jgi:hypothetical protein
MSGDTPTKKQGGYSGKVPTVAVIALEQEMVGLEHGTATLTIHIRDRKIARFTVGRERSFLGDSTEQVTGGKK